MGAENTPGKMVNISILGDPGCGKTSLKKYILGKKFDSNERITVGAQFSFTEIPKFKGIKLKIADIAGQYTFDAVRNRFLAGSDAALLVFDLTKPQSLKNVYRWLQNYIQANKRQTKSLPVILLGNKADLDRKVDLSSVKDFLSLVEEDHSMRGKILDYIETSAKTGLNVEKSFTQITSKALEPV